jgi:uncharacterized protein YunC (DUF1805 family)
VIVETELIETKKGAAFGIKVKLGKAPLILVRADKGYLVCGYFDKKVVEKLRDCCAMVPGVKSFDDMKRKKVAYASKAAQKLGIKKRMPGVVALDRLIS